MNLSPITVIGNVSNEPELTFTQSGQARLSFSVASNHFWYDSEGNKQEKVSFFNIVAWRYLAEHSARTLQKGVGVVIYGRLEQRTYTDSEGNNRSIVDVLAEDIGIATKSIEDFTRRTAQSNQQDGGQTQGNRGQQQQRRQRPMTGVGASQGAAEEPF